MQLTRDDIRNSLVTESIPIFIKPQTIPFLSFSCLFDGRIVEISSISLECENSTDDSKAGEACHVTIRADDTTHVTELWAYVAVEVVSACYLDVLFWLSNIMTWILTDWMLRRLEISMMWVGTMLLTPELLHEFGRMCFCRFNNEISQQSWLFIV